MSSDMSWHVQHVGIYPKRRKNAATLDMICRHKIRECLAQSEFYIFDVLWWVNEATLGLPTQQKTSEWQILTAVIDIWSQVLICVVNTNCTEAEIQQWPSRTLAKIDLFVPVLRTYDVLRSRLHHYVLRSFLSKILCIPLCIESPDLFKPPS